MQDSRCKARLPFKLSPENLKGRLNMRQTSLTLEGYTCNISVTGIALIVPSINTSDQNLLTDTGNTLKITLDLPTGPIQMLAVPVHYNKLTDGEVEKGILLGVRVLDMEDGDCVRFVKYLRTL